MKVITLPDVLHEYLVHVIEKHATGGIHPEEGIAVASLWDAVTKKVSHIDDAAVQKMAKAGSPQGQSAPVDPQTFASTDPRNPQGLPVECEKCFDEEGSLACIRPAHQNAAKA
jgi:hypothetical protein